MTLATIIMIVLICLGCAFLLGGLAYAANYGYRLVRAARKTGIRSREDVQDFIRRVRALGPRLQEMREKQEVVAERLQTISATTNRLRYFKDEIDPSTGYLSKLKS
jgi:hypothetical protein